jgi:hypothetical protein
MSGAERAKKEPGARATSADDAAVGERLREVSRLTDLRAARRLDVKVDMSASAVTRRLRRQSALRSLCLRLAASRPTGS